MGVLLCVELAEIEPSKGGDGVLGGSPRRGIVKLKHWCILSVQENKRLDHALHVRPWNADGLLRECDFCGDRFHHLAAHVMVPARASGIPGVYGIFCSWNCAKRYLLRLGNRPWFALMAITALRTGCRLPILVNGNEKQIVRFIPKDLANVMMRKYIHTPLPPITETEGETRSDSQPEVYDIY